MRFGCKKLCAVFVAMCFFALAACGNAGDGEKPGGEPPSSHVHAFVLRADESRYECACGKWYPSGAGSVENNGASFGDGNGYEYMEKEQENYLFIGSSVTRGCNGTCVGFAHYSMADMMREKWLRVSFTAYENDEFVTDEAYFRKIDDVPDDKDGLGGVYRYDTYELVLDGNGAGTFADERFEYIVAGNGILLKRPTGKLFALEATAGQGDTVYKYAFCGGTLSDVQTRYTYDGQQINMTGRKSYVNLLDDAVADLRDTKIDTLFLQLSTNDAGQFKDSTHREHLDYGRVKPADVTSSGAFDKNTSFGAMEYIIAKAKEVWNCEVVLFACHKGTGNVENYREMHDIMVADVAPKWKTGVIDMFADNALNTAMAANASRYLCDTVHLTEYGYERFLWQEFRAYIAEEGEQRA